MIKQMSLIALGAATLFMAPTVVHAAMNEGPQTDTMTSDADVEVENSKQSLFLVAAPDVHFGKVSNYKNSNAPISATATQIDNNLTVRNPKGERWRLNVAATSFKGTNGTLEGAKLNFNAGTVSRTDENHYPYDTLPTANAVSNVNNQGGEIMRYSGTEAGEYKVDHSQNVKLEIPKWSPKGTYESKITWTLILSD